MHGVVQSSTATSPSLSFPPGFRWGAATAAFQVEGATAADGRGRSVWDTFTARPGTVLDGSTAEVAVDHYHRYREDVALMAALGLTTYRFSVSWPRIQPTGRGPANQRGLDFYSSLVDELLAHGIEPMLTLYHWDHPQALEDSGGWANRDTAERFADYAGLVAARLGDRVPLWTTLNEPWCSAFLGHASGIHAPGRQDDVAALRAVHHLNVAHGLAVGALRAVLPEPALVSIALNPAPIRPATGTERDADAARRADALRNRIFLDPLLGKGYPADLLADTAHLTDWSFVASGDLGLVSAPLDLLGINYYTPLVVTGAPGRPDPYSPWVGSEDRVGTLGAGGPDDTIHGAVDPRGLYDLLERITRDYPTPPVIIAENGASYPDHVEPDGRVHDPRRIAYIQAHLATLAEAIHNGMDVRGYITWSLIDNFEWAYGYSQTFGLIHVDRETQRRTIKSSGHWLRQRIRDNAV
jgi:beta-glucosidase